MKIPNLVIESTAAETDLCHIGKASGTDKSPYNVHGHRHPYTAVYSLLLSRFREQSIRFAEIGIAGGASVLMWSSYFKNPQRKLFFFDCDKKFIQHAESFRLADVFCLEMDVMKKESIEEGLKNIGGDLDVILDDSTHGIPEQVKIIKHGLPYLKPGGMFIIEDIFRRYKEEDYERELESVLDQFSFVTFITCEHVNKWSPDWDNDKLLVLVKK
jgi:predicted O-methyltransferase YrrM